MNITRSTHNRLRGSAVLTALYVSVVLAGLLIAAVAATRVNVVETSESDNYARSVAAAEYGAELAVAQITAGLRTQALEEGGDKSTVVGDWVSGTDDLSTLFTTEDGVAVDQRRITGVIGDQEFRVRIRSARLAHDSNNDGENRTMPVTWLSNPGKYEYGVDRDFKFSDSYEITATAQNISAGSFGGRNTARPVIQTVIGMSTKNPMGDILNEIGVGHLEQPENFQLTGGVSDLVVTDSEGFPGVASVDSIAITGEDHLLDKYEYHILTPVEDDGNGAMLRYYVGTDLDLYRARHRYWRYGKLTVHRRTDVSTRDFANPYRPTTTNFHKSGSWHWLTDKESEREGVVYTKEMFLDDKQSMIALYDDASRDDYLMGGKGSGTTGRTITLYKDENGEERIYETKHSQASKWNSNFYDDSDDDWWYGDGDEDDDDDDDGDDDDDDDDDDDEESEKYPGNEDDGEEHEDEDDEESGDEIIHDVMVARAEDMARLYINISAVSPVERDSVMGTVSSTNMSRLEAKFGSAKMLEWKHQLLFKGMHLPTRVKDWWYQNYIGQYTTDGVKAKKLYKAFPHVADKTEEHVRPRNLFILTRPYSEKPGEQRRLMLVREYVRRDKKSGQITGLSGRWKKANNKIWQWEGNYTWVPVKMEFRSGGVICMHVKKSVHSGAHTVPRLFSWQELVGSSLVKRDSGAWKGEPAVDENGNTSFALDDGGKRIAVGFDEYHQQGDYMGYQPVEDTVPMTAAELASSVPYAGSKRGSKMDFKDARKVADRRVIWVRDHSPILALASKKREALHETLAAMPNHGLVPHTNLEDFAIEHIFNDGNREITHKVVGITVAMEAKQEHMFHKGTDSAYKKAKADPDDGRTITNAEYRRIYDNEGFRYNGMVFNVYIAPKMLEERGYEDDDNSTTYSLEWWEREEVDGLTGLQAIPAISTNKETSTLESRNITNENYNLLGHSPKHDESFMATMYTSASRGVDYKESLTSLYGEDDVDGRELLPTFSPGFARAVFGENGDSAVLLESYLDKIRKDKNIIADRLETGGPVYFYYTETDLREIVHQNRSFYTDEGAPDLELARTHMIQSNPTTITLGDNEVMVELHFADIGERWDLESVSKGVLQAAQIYDPMAEEEDIGQTSYKVLPNEIYARRMAGEVIGYTMQTVPAIRTVDLQPMDEIVPQSHTLGFLAGELLHDRAEPVLTAAGTVPVRSLGGVTQADGTEVVVRDFTAPTAEEAVAMCYVDYYADDIIASQAVLKRYGLKDQRRSIGFHRFGPDEKYREIHGQDHYEVISLGVAGFNPFKAALTGSEEYVALERVGEEGSDVFEQALKYGDDAASYVKVPDFVFDEPIDGAGTMVVNGNLVIRSRFAYHGTLIVLGDVIIDPVLTDRAAFGLDGNPMDKYGNSLTMVDGVWHYTWTGTSGSKLTSVYLDVSGNPIIDSETGTTIPVEYLVLSTYDSELVLQGNLLLKGRLMNNTVPDLRDVSGESTISGKARLFWSSEAIESTAKYWSENTILFDRHTWVHNDAINVDTIWADMQDATQE